MKSLSLVSLLCLLSYSVLGQCIPNSNPTFGLTCDTAPYLCCGEIDNFTGTLPDFANPNGPLPLCPNGGVTNNMQWLVFGAGTTNISLNFNISNCTTVTMGGDQFTGMQIGIYSGCDFLEPVYCDADCLVEPFTVHLTGLEIGHAYFIFLDGCAGAVCDYAVEVFGGTTEAPAPGPITSIIGPGINGNPNDACSNASYAATGLFLSGVNWSLVGGAGNTQFTEDGLTMHVTEWGGAGSYTICANGYNDCFPDSNPANQFCQTITVDGGAAGTEIPYNGIDDDCDPTTLDDDLDQDGFLLADDCDDMDASINPFASEVAYNGIDDDCDPNTLDDDLDEDGFLLVDDCDDMDASINPSVAEMTYNGIDDDCDPATLDDDLDEDGYLLVDDCDDTDALINPGATEILDNDIDENCDGEILTAVNEIDATALLIYPNPVRDVLLVKTENQISSIELINCQGHSVMMLSNPAKELDFQKIEIGIYFLKIKIEEKYYFKKLIKI